MSRDHWTLHAACRGEDPNDFIVNANDSTQHKAAVLKAALKFCDVCPVRSQCLDLGKRTRSHGVFGGELLPFRQKRAPAVCGTDSGYQAHTRNGETICGPCRDAHNKYRQRLHASKKQAGAA